VGNSPRKLEGKHLNEPPPPNVLAAAVNKRAPIPPPPGINTVLSMAGYTAPINRNASTQSVSSTLIAFGSFPYLFGTIGLCYHHAHLPIRN
jgi:hypothetical protein